MLQANLQQFKQLTTILDEEEYYEIEKSKPELRLSLPIQIGYFILQYAKLHMLQLYYDFLDTLIDRADFQYCEMDTDYAYLAVSAPRLIDVIKTYMLPTYTNGLEGYCCDEIIEADADLHWIPRTCCTKHAKFDKRPPGLFKLVYEGDFMIGLQPKPKIRHEVKLSSKGVSKRRITAPMTIYRRVLRTQRAGCRSIQDFRARNNRIYT
jgi:hypothetical protein